MFKDKLSLILKILLVPAALFLLLSIRFYADNREFSNFTRQMFQNEVAGNTLNLHYTLSDPAAFGIEDYQITLGSADVESLNAGIAVLENYRETLNGISYKDLSKNNKLTYDILSMYLENQAEGKDFLLYAEPLGPTIGTQAQLPVLLAEYTFSDTEDIKEYLTLISQMDTYYASIMDFEKAKSQAGLFMSDQAADNIISQCSSFIGSEENFLIPIFEEKVDKMEGLSETVKTSLKEKHRALVAAHVIPAYELLIKGLTGLKGTGTNTGGLSNFEHGREYYEYLVKDSTGCYDSISDLEARIQKQLVLDFQELQTLVTEHPDLLTSTETASLKTTAPDQILEDLQEKIAQDFPTPPSVNYEVKYVHDSLEDYLSPAFYLTPPVDNLSENVIYINRGSNYTPLELYTTLAHEGYPGHLYQTIYSGSCASNEVRSVLNFGGYVEGWATYVEMYSYSLADVKPQIASLYRLNRSISLGISSLMDMAIHYHGFTQDQVADYLTQIGFRGKAMADSLYSIILEAPANYLKYYVGYLNFMDLRDAVKETEGDGFSLKKFHQRVLEIGPAPFPVLKRYLLPETEKE